MFNAETQGALRITFKLKWFTPDLTQTVDLIKCSYELTDEFFYLSGFTRIIYSEPFDDINVDDTTFETPRALT